MLGDYSLWQEAVLNAKKNGYEAIFIGLYHTLVDDDGKHVSEQTVLEWTSAHSPVPLFCFWEFSVGTGKAIGGLVLDGVISQSDAQAAQLWRLREGITEALARYKPYKNDIAVRVSAMPAFLAETQALLAQEYPQFEVVWFGHIGDGNLHINVLKPDAMENDAFVAQCEQVTKLLADALQRHGGSISAEHGIGLVKKGYLDSTRGSNHHFRTRNNIIYRNFRINIWKYNGFGNKQLWNFCKFSTWNYSHSNSGN